MVRNVGPNSERAPDTESPLTIVEHHVVSPQLINGNSTFEVNLNFEINIMKINAIAANTHIQEIGIITIETPVGTVQSLARILLHTPDEQKTPYLFHVVENFPGNYAGIIGCLSTYDPSEYLEAEE